MRDSAVCGLDDGRGDDRSTAVISICPSGVDSPSPFDAGCAPFSITFFSVKLSSKNPS